MNKIIDKLRIMTPDQLKELFIDLDDPIQADHIANIAYEFVESWADREIAKYDAQQGN